MSFREEATKENADKYEQMRFTRSRRMRRLNRIEMKFAQDLMELVGVEAAVLDVPCGSGRFFEIFKPAKKLFMYDYSANMINTFLAKSPEAAERNIGTADITDLPIEDNSVDLAFCMRMFHHIKEHEMRVKALSELTRVSRKYVAFSFYCTSSWRYIKKHIRGKKLGRTPISMKEMLTNTENLGLKLLDTRPKFEFIEMQRYLLFEKSHEDQS